MLVGPPRARARNRFATITAAGLVLAGLVSQARAEDDDPGVRRGLALRRQGKDQDALKEFQEAYARSKSPRAAAQVGLAEQALGQWTDAETHVSEALADAANPWIRKNTATLQNALAEIQRHLGSLEVIGPAGAEVRANGQLLGALPFKKPARVPIGVVNVELRKAGFLPTVRPVSIVAGTLTRESVSLLNIPEAPIRKEPSEVHERNDRLTDSAATPQSAHEEHAADVADTTGHWHRPLAWATGIGAVLGLGGGTAALVVRANNLTQANSLMCRISSSGTVNPPDARNAGQCVDLANSSARLGVAGVTMLSVGAALAIVSVILFVTDPDRPAARTTAFACGPAPSMRGAACLLLF